MSVRKFAVLVVALALSESASATPITYEFSAPVAVSGWCCGYDKPWYDFGFPDGTVMHGTFTVETDTPAIYQDGRIQIFHDALTAATISFGANGEFGNYSLGDKISTLQPFGSSIVTVNDDSFPYDEVDVFSSVQNVAGDPANFYRTFSLSSPYEAGLYTQLPSLDALFGAAGTNAFPLSVGFAVREEGDFPAGFRDESISGEVTNLSVVSVSVPEPETLMLFGAGLLALRFARRRPTAT